MPRKDIRKSNQVPGAPRYSVQPAPTWRKLRYFWLRFVASVTMLSAFQLNGCLSPQVEAAKGEAPDLKNALSTRFIVISRSPSAPPDVQPYCDGHNVRLRSTYKFRGLRRTGTRAAILDKGDQWSVICPVSMPEGNGAQLTNVTVQITFCDRALLSAVALTRVRHDHSRSLVAQKALSIFQ